MNAELLRKLREGKLQEPSKDMKEIESCVMIQRRMRGIQARKKVEGMRYEEMIFLGMNVKPKNVNQMKNDPIKKMEQYMRERKKIQKGNEKMYNHA